MDVTVIVVASAALLAWRSISHAGDRADVTAPFASVVVGPTLPGLMNLVGRPSGPEATTPLVEATLAPVEVTPLRNRTSR